MKQIFTLLCALVCLSGQLRSQVLLNELYTDPGAGKQEFFELYNTNPSSSPFPVDNLTLVTFFEISGQKGFYVMDLPNMTVAARNYFVGAAGLPFNYQGITGSTAADFSWNSPSFTANNGYIKKWVQGVANLTDGNLFYDQAPLPVNFNDFLFRRTGSGASYTVFLYNKGALVNTFVGGTGGSATIINDIVNMPNLFVDMTASSPDFTINFTGYGTIPVESVGQDAGSDNGYIRQYDGACGTWTKSSAGVQHTPKVTNGTLIGLGNGSVAISAAISTGTPAAGSTLNNDIVSAPAGYFPIELQIFTDLGSTAGILDATDVYVQSNTETIVSDGPFYTNFHPYNANILIAAKTNMGCFDKIIFIPNTIILSVKMIAFSGTRHNHNIALSWTTEGNEMADRFELQKSTDGQLFSTIAVILATENSGSQTYSYTDPGTEDAGARYRLRIFSKSGTVAYSEIVTFPADKAKGSALSITNNPVTASLNMQFNASSNREMNFRVINMGGQPIQQGKLYVSKGLNRLSLPLVTTLQRGAYVVELENGDTRYTARFIKQ